MRSELLTNKIKGDSIRFVGKYCLVYFSIPSILEVILPPKVSNKFLFSGLIIYPCPLEIIIKSILLGCEYIVEKSENPG